MPCASAPRAKARKWCRCARRLRKSWRNWTMPIATCSCTTWAWTVKKGATAPQAAGVIHTDFERGFIRAETVGYDDYVKFRGEAGAKEQGKLRLEGKEYVVREGDVLHFRFNV